MILCQHNFSKFGSYENIWLLLRLFLGYFGVPDYWFLIEVDHYSNLRLFNSLLLDMALDNLVLKPINIIIGDLSDQLINLVVFFSLSLRFNLCWLILSLLLAHDNRFITRLLDLLQHPDANFTLRAL